MDITTLTLAKAYTDEQIEKSATGGVPLDHSKLTNRDSKNQHPIVAIEGLQNELNKLQNAKNIFSTISESDFWGTEDELSVQAAIDFVLYTLKRLHSAEYIVYTPADPDVDVGGEVVSVQTAIDVVISAIKEIADAEYISTKDMPEIVKSVINNLPKYNGEVAEV